VAEHLHNWLEGYVKTNCSPRTLDGYQSIIEHHLIPALGQLQLKHLHPQAIQKYYGQACEKLSPRTVHHFHRVLSQSLKFAVRQGYLGRNPAEMVYDSMTCGIRSPVLCYYVGQSLKLSPRL